jgi:hypothetical protein
MGKFLAFGIGALMSLAVAMILVVAQSPYAPGIDLALQAIP